MHIELRIPSTIVVTVVLAATSVGESARAASFQPLGDLPGGAFESIAYDVTNQRVVVGQSAASGGGEAFRWTAQGGMQSLGIPDSDARGITPDGTVIVGTQGLGSGRPLAYRLENGAIEILEAPPYTDPMGDVSLRASWAYGVSADGSTVVGAGESNADLFDFNLRYPIAWSGAGFVAPYGTAVTVARPFDGAYSASADGSAFAGTTSIQERDPAAFRYAGCCPEFVGGFFSLGNGISADGTIVVGSSTNFAIVSNSAFRWSEVSGFEYLLDAGGQQRPSSAWDVSADGSVIVGVVELPDFFGELQPAEAMVWTEETGMVSLRQALDFLGVDAPFAGWSQTRALAVSANGQVVVGDGLNPAGQREAWIAVIPEPSVGLLIGLGLGLLGSWGRLGRGRG